MSDARCEPLTTLTCLPLTNTLASSGGRPWLRRWMRKWRRLAQTCGLGRLTICVIGTCLGAAGIGVGVGVVVVAVVAGGGCTIVTASALESAGALSPPALWPTTRQRISCPASLGLSAYVAAAWPSMATPSRVHTNVNVGAPVQVPASHVTTSPG